MIYRHIKGTLYKRRPLVIVITRWDRPVTRERGWHCPLCGQGYSSYAKRPLNTELSCTECGSRYYQSGEAYEAWTPTTPEKEPDYHPLSNRIRRILWGDL